MQRSNSPTGETEPLLVVLSGRDQVSAREFSTAMYPYNGNPGIFRREISPASAELVMDEIAGLFRRGADTIILAVIEGNRSVVNEVRSNAQHHNNWKVEWRSFEFADAGNDCAAPDSAEVGNILVCPVERRRKPR